MLWPESEWIHTILQFSASDAITSDAFSVIHDLRRLLDVGDLAGDERYLHVRIVVDFLGR